ncbi:MAG: hypothetical protein HY360_23950 [Verrucomicrobia bacterium]|nr:hypothetical protein [Verrucomicrobiota bacterium]
MNLLEAAQRLRRTGAVHWSTHEAAGVLQLSLPATSMTLARLAQKDAVVRLHRGAWAFADARVQPSAIATALSNGYPCYVSLQSALYQHGMIEQIPHVTYLVTLGRTRVVDTPQGRFSFHQVAPPFFHSFVPDSVANTPMAIPEKALCDFFYLSPARSGLFRSLPELTLPQGFSWKKAWQIARTASARRRSLILSRLDQFRKKNH